MGPEVALSLTEIAVIPSSIEGEVIVTDILTDPRSRIMKVFQLIRYSELFKARAHSPSAVSMLSPVTSRLKA